MAVGYFCDGCGERLEEGDVKTFGLVRQVIAGDCCAEAYQAYLAGLDALHDRIAADFAKGLAKLRKDHGKALRALPDA